jgi:hypothetical protein
MNTSPKYRFDPVDHNFMRIRGRLTMGERLQAMLAAREWVFAAHRARVQRQQPNLSPEEVNLCVLEEIDRAERRRTRSHTVP